jgi:hypothetical protein
MGEFARWLIFLSLDSPPFPDQPMNPQKAAFQLLSLRIDANIIRSGNAIKLQIRLYPWQPVPMFHWCLLVSGRLQSNVQRLYISETEVSLDVFVLGSVNLPIDSQVNPLGSHQSIPAPATSTSLLQ